jgi:hypothetical protein
LYPEISFEPTPLRFPDVVIRLQWFSEIVSRLPLSHLISDVAGYHSFEAARKEGPTALAAYFQKGLSFSEVLIRSAGLVPDGQFRRLPPGTPLPVSPRRPSGPYVLVCNDAEGPSVCLHQTKQVPASMWREILNGLVELDCEICEAGMRSAVAFSHPRYRSLVGQTSFLEWLEVIRGASAILCIEGATAHVAAALGKPCIVLCGPTSPQAYGHALHSYISSPVCVPCQWKTLFWFAHCMQDIGQACMYAHDAGAVVRKVSAQLSSDRLQGG